MTPEEILLVAAFAIGLVAGAAIGLMLGQMRIVVQVEREAKKPESTDDADWWKEPGDDAAA